VAEFIEPIIEHLIAVLRARTSSFSEFGKLFSGAAINVDAIWVMPERTSFAEEGSTLDQVHEITVKFGIEATELDDVAHGAMARMREAHKAIEASWPGDWQEVLKGGQVSRIWIRQHNYGPTYANDGRMAKFPELSLVVETKELREEAE